MSTQDDVKEKSRPKQYSFLLDGNTPPPFSVGLTVNLQTMVERYKKNRFPVMLAGWIRSRNLLVYHHQYDTGILAIPKETELIARYIYEGQIYGFATTLLHKQSEPIPLWFLEYPLEIEVINLRQSSRIPITLEIKTSDGEVYFTRDISKQGASLRMSTQSEALLIERKMGETVILNFSLPDNSRIENLKSTIVRLTIEQNQKSLGVKFHQSDYLKLEALALYLDRLEKDFVTTPVPDNWD